jgi:nucleotide-binding universal stress UspA family protein
MKILLAIDGSACSEAAVEEIARRPWPADSQVRIISVVEPPAPLAAEPYMPPPTDYFAEVEKAARNSAQEVVARAESKLREGCKLLISTEVLRGSPRRLIIEEAERWSTDLIIVGSHGYRSWERMLLGSVSQAVAMHAECSVEIVRRKQ